MLRHYLTIAWRNLIRHKAFSLINTLGLALGFACCCLLVLLIRHEFSIDDFQEHRAHLYKLSTDFKLENYQAHSMLTPSGMLPLLTENYSEEIIAGTRIAFSMAFVREGNDRYKEKALIYADPAFFELFSFRTLEGNPQLALEHPYSLVLTHSTAQKYFGPRNPIGQRLKIGRDSTDYIVQAIVEDVPANSHFYFGMVAPFHMLEAAKNPAFSPANYHTYLWLRQAESLEKIKEGLPNLLQTHAEADFAEGVSYHFQPMEKIYFHSAHLEPDGDIRTGDIDYIYFLAALAGVILLIACFNYINLSTARAMDRAKEVGMRKVIGAQPGQLMRQFLGETFLLTCIGLTIGLILAELLLPWFSELTQRDFDIREMLQMEYVLAILGLGVLTTLLAGFYPAWILIRSRAVNMLKGSFRFSEKGKWLRKGLVVAQFAASVVLIASTLMISRQIRFLQQKPLGYEREQVVILPIHWQEQAHVASLQRALAQLPQVLSITSCSESPHQIRGTYRLQQQGREEPMSVKAMAIDEHFVETMKLQLIAGADIRPAHEQMEEFAFILNEKAIEELGFTPESAIGEIINLHNRHGRIQGVVRDFHFASLHEAIGPVVLYSKGFRKTLMVRLSAGDMQQHLQQLESNWNEHIVYQPFEYQFLDEELTLFYAAEERLQRLGSSFALLAICIAALGLLGLASYTAVQRQKEIGIRKVLGASVFHITRLLSLDFLKLIGIAYLIALPISGWFMHQWLQNFNYHMDMGWEMFGLSGLIALVIAWLAMGFQTLKAARMNPVEALRNE